MWRQYFLFCIYLLTKFTVGDMVYSTSPLVTQTDKGLVMAEILTTALKNHEFLSFQGIPFAKPPFGDLRFKPPVEVDPWTGVFLANKRDIECVQKNRYTNVYTGVEDCLVLNVYTPELDLRNRKSDLRTVLVWFHGGSFKSGSGAYSIYGPDHFMERDIVLVTSNYRLGPLGFMTLNHPEAVGNNALKDQNMVLKWIQRNIQNFGGDPNNVVIFGESAGAASVDFHVLSDMSRGLFHKSISMSGSPFCPWSFMTKYKSERQAFHLGKLLNNNNMPKDKDELMEILHNKTTLEIMEKLEDMSKFVPAFLPSLEDPDVAPNEEKFMTQCYLSKYVSGNYSKVPHLMGFTSNEALIFSKAFDNFLESEKDTIDEINKLNLHYPSLSIFANIVVKLCFLLFELSTWLVYEILEMASDIIFYVGIDMKQRIMLETEHDDLYYYRISFSGAEGNTYHEKILGLQILQGTSHADDIFYLFYPRLMSISIAPGSPTAIITERMVTLWVNFAKYSDPTPDNRNDSNLIEIEWPESDHRGSHLDIGSELSVKYTRPVDENVDSYEKAHLETILHSRGCIDRSTLKALRMNPLHPTLGLFDFFHQLIVNC